MRILFWRLLAILFLLLGMIGIVLPGLPTVPFVLLAAWAGGRGWPALEARLLAHPEWGPSIRNWREHGAVSRRAKWASAIMMSLGAVLLVLSAAPAMVKICVPLVMLGVSVWLWRRPEV